MLHGLRSKACDAALAARPCTRSLRAEVLRSPILPTSLSLEHLTGVELEGATTFI